MQSITLPETLTREQIAQREIGRTDISAGLSWVMTVLFLLTLTVPPTAQLVHEVLLGEQGRTPSSLELFHALPDVAGEFHRTQGSIWTRVLATNRRLVRSIEDYERQLEERSLLTQHLLGPIQHTLTSLTGLGNEKAYIGRDGWLFYRPDVDYLTGPGFLEPAVLHRRALSGKQHLAPHQPDPRPAIIEFHEQLKRRGIRLILMPVPCKAAIHPEQLSSRYDCFWGHLENASFQRFKQEMEVAGVLVFDSTPILAGSKNVSKHPQPVLRTDTHWTPDEMESVVIQLTIYIQQHCPLPSNKPAEFVGRFRDVSNIGDIANMLRLPQNQSLFAPETMEIGEVLEAGGRSWRPDEQADVLLLGDSYSNIYSLAEMNWGASAGLAERLSFQLNRRIDRLAQNDGGSHATRQAVYQQLARGHDRLKGKRVVIWEFAMRELAIGDWKLLGELPVRSKSENNELKTSPPTAGEVIVKGTVRAAAGAPQPGSVPYRDAVTAVHLDGVSGLGAAFTHREIVVYLWGLRDNRLLPAAKFASNEKVTLRLTPWDAVRDRYERFNRIELDDPDFHLAELPTYWAEEAP